MKKIIKIALYSLLAIIILGLAILHISYHSFSSGDKGIPVDEKNLVYFQESYDECRQAFLSEAAKVVSINEKARIFAVRVPSEIDQDLYIDLLYLPPLKDTSKLLVISSAVHGVEGFTGSAVQQMFLNELVNEEVLSETGVEGYAETYGYLYSWESAKDVCPEGWHLPNDAEFVDLVSSQGGYFETAGGKLKEPGTAHWKSPNTGATNSSGFTALSCGKSNDNEGKYYFGVMTYFWTSEDMDETLGFSYALYSGKAEFSRYGLDKGDGVSVRCLKD